MWLVWTLFAINIISAICSGVNGLVSVNNYYNGKSIRKYVTATIVFGFVMYFAMVGITAIFGRVIIS